MGTITHMEDFNKELESKNIPIEVSKVKLNKLNKNSFKSSPVKWISWRVKYQSSKTEKYKYSDVNKENKESRNRYRKTSETPLKGQIYDLKKEKEKQGVGTN